MIRDEKIEFTERQEIRPKQSKKLKDRVEQVYYIVFAYGKKRQEGL